ncbi:MAG: hypothetical protein IJO14_10325 [Clostridia bacterium]|nr:hypothetical protein [Clostridia bacterium]
MDIKFEDLFDFSASTGDWVGLFERLLFAIADFFKFAFGIDLFAPEAEETTGE